jgi:ABC-type Co2+ transport system permease subunit
MSRPFEPHPRWLAAILAGAAMAVALVVGGIWATLTGTPLLWLFLGPWAFVGLLLIVWGWQRRPRPD